MADITTLFGPPPEGVDLSDNVTPQNNAITIALFSLAVIAVVLRFVTRLAIQKIGISASDWLIAVALLPLAALLAATILGGYYGLGKHVWSLTVDHVIGMRVILFAYVFIYLSLIAVIKVSILLFYRRVFGINWSMWVCGFLSVGYAVGSIIAFLCSCQPLSYFWTQFEDPTGGKCIIDLYGFYIGNAAVNVFTDVLILLVPLPIVWKLQMRTMKKVLITAIFFLGGFVTVASIIRIVYMSFLNSDPDITWVMGSVYVWSTVEPSIGVVCACLPTLKPMLNKVLKAVGGSRFASFSRTGPSKSNQRNQYSNTRSGNQYHNHHGFRSRHGQSTDPDSQLCDDEIVLTTVAANGDPPSSRKEEDSMRYVDPAGPLSIKVQRDFEWSERSH